MNWSSCHPADLLTALGMKLNSSLSWSMSTSMSFSWHDSNSCVSADSFRTSAFLFFCDPPALLTAPVQTGPELPEALPSCYSSKCSFAFTAAHLLNSSFASNSSLSTSVSLLSQSSTSLKKEPVQDLLRRLLRCMVAMSPFRCVFRCWMTFNSFPCFPDLTRSPSRALWHSSQRHVAATTWPPTNPNLPLSSPSQPFPASAGMMPEECLQLLNPHQGILAISPGSLPCL